MWNLDHLQERKQNTYMYVQLNCKTSEPKGNPTYVPMNPSVLEFYHILSVLVSGENTNYVSDHFVQVLLGAG